MLDPVIVGRAIQEFRERKGLSQEVVSGLADIGRTHLVPLNEENVSQLWKPFFGSVRR